MIISELKRIAKNMTSEEFLKEYVDFCCPSAFDMTSLGDKCFSKPKGDIEWCTTCWKNAIKDEEFKFKDEEIIEQPKEYKISDLLSSFEEETEFISSNIKYKIQEGELCYYNIHKKEWATSLNCLKTILYMKFTKVEDPKLKHMTFEEAVHTLKNVKYELFNDKQDKFYPPNVTIKNILERYPVKTTAIILEGTWFAEGVYE